MLINIQPPLEKTVVANSVEIWLNDGIMRVLYLDHAEITPGIKEQMHHVFLEMTGGKKHPFIFEMQGAIWYTKAAREYARAIEPKQPFLAVAMLAPTLGYRLLAEIYAKIYKPQIPYKVFWSEEEALPWLRSFPPIG